ncbi:MAG: hypothetical protein ACJ8M1_06045 [Chthoniobacterales bacterium]
MTANKLNKDQIKKVGLTAVGFVILLYVYFSFFLGPLNRSRNTMLTAIAEKRAKINSSQENLSKTAKLEQQAKSATTRFAALKALNPEGAPIAWFPPRMKAFFGNQQIDKVTARLENNTAFKQPEMANWLKYTWLIDVPQVDYAQLGKAIADLENTEPLLTVSKLSIRASADQPEYQQVALSAVTVIPKQ